MDQLAPVITWIKTNRFWIGCFLLAVTMTALYFIGSSSTDKDRKKLVSKRNASFSDTTAILNANADEVESAEVKVHPNQFTQEGMESRITKAEESAIEAWIAQYNKQKGTVRVARG